jgi:hypothetical protein
MSNAERTALKDILEYNCCKALTKHMLPVISVIASD